MDRNPLLNNGIMFHAAGYVNLQFSRLVIRFGPLSIGLGTDILGHAQHSVNFRDAEPM